MKYLLLVLLLAGCCEEAETIIESHIKDCTKSCEEQDMAPATCTSNNSPTCCCISKKLAKENLKSVQHVGEYKSFDEMKRLFEDKYGKEHDPCKCSYDDYCYGDRDCSCTRDRWRRKGWDLIGCAASGASLTKARRLYKEEAERKYNQKIIDEWYQDQLDGVNQVIVHPFGGWVHLGKCADAHPTTWMGYTPNQWGKK